MTNHKVIVLKTNIQSEQMLRLVAPIFKKENHVKKWSVDLEDCDKVLRVESNQNITESGLIRLLVAKGVMAEVLE